MRFEAPTSIDAAVALLAAEGGTSRLLAGGTDVLVQLRSGMVEPDLVVDIKRIPGLDSIADEDGGWRVGAAVPAVEMKEHAALYAAWPGGVCAPILSQNKFLSEEIRCQRQADLEYRRNEGRTTNVWRRSDKKSSCKGYACWYAAVGNERF